MKRSLARKITGCAAGLILIAGLAACGNDSGFQQGQVVKGIVVGATVTDAAGNVQGVTGADGKFTIKSAGPFVSTGGRYTDMTGVVRIAPVLSADAGSTNITPLTTLIHNAPADVKSTIIALIAATGLKADDVITGTIPNDPKVVAFVKLNETVGEALRLVSEQGVSSAAMEVYAESLATKIAALPSIATADSATLVTAVTSASVPSGVTAPSSGFLTTIATETKPGAIPTPPPAGPSDTTGTTGTGGSSSGLGV